MSTWGKHKGKREASLNWNKEVEVRDACKGRNISSYRVCELGEI